MEAILKPGDRILLLASYCQDKEIDPLCSDNLPCLECLKMDNVAEVKENVLIDVIGGWGYFKGIQNKE